MNNKEKRLSVQVTLLEMFRNMGMNIPINIETITDFVFEDVCETADPTEWHSGDVAIAFRRWVESNVNDDGDDDECMENVHDKIVHDKNVQSFGYGEKLNTVGELRKLMSDLDANDLIVIEGIDLQTGDVQDLYPMNLDVIDGIELNDGSIVREVRFCQMKNQTPDTRDKQPLVDAVINDLKSNMSYGDFTVLEECLFRLPWEILKESLPEEQWHKFNYPVTTNIWSEIKSDHEDDDKIFIDAYLTSDDNENGTVIAKVDITSNDVVYFDERAKTDKYAQEVITECFKRL